jgi:hypothetical protein
MGFCWKGDRNCAFWKTNKKRNDRFIKEATNENWIFLLLLCRRTKWRNDF